MRDRSTPPGVSEPLFRTEQTGIPTDILIAEHQNFDLDGDGYVTEDDAQTFTGDLQNYDYATHPWADLSGDEEVTLQDGSYLLNDIESYNSGGTLQHLQLADSGSGSDDGSGSQYTEFTNFGVLSDPVASESDQWGVAVDVAAPSDVGTEVTLHVEAEGSDVRTESTTVTLAAGESRRVEVGKSLTGPDLVSLGFEPGGGGSTDVQTTLVYQWSANDTNALGESEQTVGSVTVENYLQGEGVEVSPGVFVSNVHAVDPPFEGGDEARVEATLQNFTNAALDVVQVEAEYGGASLGREFTFQDIPPGGTETIASDMGTFSTLDAPDLGFSEWGEDSKMIPVALAVRVNPYGDGGSGTVEGGEAKFINPLTPSIGFKVSGGDFSPKQGSGEVDVNFTVTVRNDTRQQQNIPVTAEVLNERVATGEAVGVPAEGGTATVDLSGTFGPYDTAGSLQVSAHTTYDGEVDGARLGVLDYSPTESGTFDPGNVQVVSCGAETVDGTQQVSAKLANANDTAAQATIVWLAGGQEIASRTTDIAAGGGPVERATPDLSGLAEGEYDLGHELRDITQA